MEFLSLLLVARNQSGQGNPDLPELAKPHGAVCPNRAATMPAEFRAKDRVFVE